MKTRTLMALATFLTLVIPGSIQAQTVTAQGTTIVECSSKPYFSDNECQVCQD